MQSMQQVVGAASMAVGLRAGDSGMAQKGADMFGEGLGVSKGSTPSQPAPAERPVSQAQGDGSNQDLQAVADRCGQIADSQFPRQAQNELMKRAACLSYCAHNITGIQRYYQMYEENQRNANSLCSAGMGNCNQIDPISRCNYQ